MFYLLSLEFDAVLIREFSGVAGEDMGLKLDDLVDHVINRFV